MHTDLTSKNMLNIKNSSVRIFIHILSVQQIRWNTNIQTEFKVGGEKLRHRSPYIYRLWTSTDRLWQKLLVVWIFLASKRCCLCLYLNMCEVNTVVLNNYYCMFNWQIWNLIVIFFIISKESIRTEVRPRTFWVIHRSRMDDCNWRISINHNMKASVISECDRLWSP